MKKYMLGLLVGMLIWNGCAEPESMKLEDSGAQVSLSEAALASEEASGWGVVGVGIASCVDGVGRCVEYTRVSLPEKMGIDKDSNVWFCVFIAVWTALLVAIWFLVRKMHSKAARQAKHWRVARFLSVLAGLSLWLLSLATPKEMSEAIIIPGGLTVIALVVAMLCSSGYSPKWKVLALVTVDVLFGLLTACLLKVLVAVVVIVASIALACVFLSATSSKSGVTKWRCKKCGHVARTPSDEVLEECPKCHSTHVVETR